MNDIIPNGVLPDSRPLDRQALDHRHEDLYGGLPVVWTEKPQSTWYLPSQRNQGTSFSCLFQSAATALESIDQTIESAAVYQLRKDPTQEGDYLQDVLDILYNKGTVIEVAAPSQNMSDPELDAVKLPTFLNLTITGYRTIGKITMEAIAEAVQAYGNCILVFYSNTQEWQITPVYNGQATTFGHAICACDFALINGQQRLIARDSAGQFSSPLGYRLLTQDFLNARCRGAAYILGVKTTPIPPPISPTTAPFLVDMSYGQSSPEIARLQTFLQKLGFFTYPENTGNYLDITRQAILGFQQKYVSPQSSWAKFVVWYYNGKNCSAMTRTALNKLLGGA